MRTASVILTALILSGCSKPAPPSSEVPASTQEAATLSQQKMCSEQAEKSFNGSAFSEPKSYPGITNMGNTYTNHFDATASICYMEVTTRNVNSRNDFQRYHLISDAFEGRVYGEFMSFSKDVGPQICSIKPRGQPEITCKSSDEFDGLALKYFGTGSD